MQARNFNQRIVPNTDDTVAITGRCIVNGSTYSVNVDPEQYQMWNSRTILIQNAFPHLSSEDREWLISGTSPDGFNTLFPPEEESGEDTDDVSDLYPNLPRID